MMDEFLKVQAESGKPGVPGWWDRVLPKLSVEQRASLEQAAASGDIGHRAISLVLGQWGFKVTAAQVGHWRRHHVTRG